MEAPAAERPVTTDQAPAKSKSRTWLYVLLGCLGAGLVFAAILAGLVISVAAAARRRAQAVQVMNLTHELELALDNFRLEHNRYPWATPKEMTPATTIDAAQVYRELCALPGAKINTTQNYLGNIPPQFLRNGRVVDIWGREILFRADPDSFEPVIWSCGPNGVDETNDGTSPDPQKKPQSFYWFGKGDTGDDIGNR
jgi:type II secretory pathway pseudopilin PulG